MDDKQRVRQVVLERRDVLKEETRIEMSLAMAEAAEAIDFLPGDVVAAYLPIRSEPDLRPLMARFRERGARLCLPVVLDRRTIAFRAFEREAPLVDTGFGTSGPGPEAEVMEPALLLMPLSAFDAKGHRLGYGAGHYDRAIARLHSKGKTPRLIGAAFSCQQCDAVPVEPHDVALEMILTEQGLRSFSQTL